MSGRYRTIVADPPWDHDDGTGTTLVGGRWQTSAGMPYTSMSLDEIRALPVRDFADRNAHLYLWTTNRYLREAYYVAEAWGFAPVKPLVWVKEPMGFMGAPFVSSAEFVLYCRRGVLSATASAGRQWWLWPRAAHSAKPEAFLDLVESVSSGPYLEMFARRQRLGWDTWGDQALEHVRIEGAA